MGHKPRPSKANSYGAYSHDWWTPPEWYSWAEQTLNRVSGDEVFDPCPSDWKPGDPDGLEVDWRSPTYCNHPGGKNKSANLRAWWAKAGRERKRIGSSFALVWCCFGTEHPYLMKPSPFELPGWLVVPPRRLPFIWGGPTTYYPAGHRLAGKVDREHGKPKKGAGDRATFWSTVEPAPPPTPGTLIIPTGGLEVRQRVLTELRRAQDEIADTWDRDHRLDRDGIKHQLDLAEVRISKVVNWLGGDPVVAPT